jgi:hypothetical protein
MPFPPGFRAGLVTRPGEKVAPEDYVLQYPEGDVWPMAILLTNWKEIVSGYLRYLYDRQSGDVDVNGNRIATDSDITRDELTRWVALTERIAECVELPIETRSMRPQLRRFASIVKRGLDFEAQLLSRKKDPRSVIDHRLTHFLWGLEQFRVAFNEAISEYPPFYSQEETLKYFVPESLGAEAARKRIERFDRSEVPRDVAFSLVLNAIAEEPFQPEMLADLLERRQLTPST